MFNVEDLIDDIYALSDEQVVAFWNAVRIGYLCIPTADPALMDIYLRTSFLANHDCVIASQTAAGNTKIVVAARDLHSVRRAIDRFTAAGVPVERVLPHCGIVVGSPIAAPLVHTIARKISRPNDAMWEEPGTDLRFVLPGKRKAGTSKQ